jgi:hypothetical protein
MKDLTKLISVLKEAKDLLARNENDFSWSSWENQSEALSEISTILASLENGKIPDIRVLFAPTGPIQEVSLSSGWGEEFIKLADRFDIEFAAAKNQS